MVRDILTKSTNFNYMRVHISQGSSRKSPDVGCTHDLPVTAVVTYASVGTRALLPTPGRYNFLKPN